MKTVYISNIPKSMESNDLYPMFQPFGDVLDVRVIKDRGTLISRGYAFVDMADSEAALGAIRTLNGTQYQGRVIRVAEASPHRPAVHRSDTNRPRGRHPHVRWINRQRRFQGVSK